MINPLVFKNSLCQAGLGAAIRLLLYLLAFLITRLFVLPGNPWWYVEAPLWLIGIQALILLLILSDVAVYWEEEGFIYSM